MARIIPANRLVAGAPVVAGVGSVASGDAWGAIASPPVFVLGTPDSWSFEPYDPPSATSFRLADDSAALPAGVTLDSANKQLDYDGSGFAGTTNDIVLESIPSAEADWIARSTAAGVVFTERFDALMIGPGAGGGRYYNGDYGQRGFRDTVIRCSGTGSLRLEHRPNENNPNMTGRYSRDTVDGGGLLPNFAPGQVFYVQFRYRIDSNWYNNIPTWGGQGHKLILLHQDNISCGQIELSLQHYASWYSTRVLRMYTGCGTPNLFTNLTNPNSQANPPMLIQQRWDIDAGGPTWQRVPGYELQYAADSPAGAFMPAANTWYTFDFRVQLPSAWGQSDCRVEAWVTAPGETQRQKFIAWIGAMFSNGEPVNVMNNLTLTGYLSNGANNAGTTGSCWYDEVIVSTQSIALPQTLPLNG